MARVMELLVGLNALGGIATFIGLRWSFRKVAGKLTVSRRKKPKEED